MTQAVSVTLREWERRSAEEPAGVDLRGRFLLDDDMRRVARGLTESGRIAVRELRTGLEVESTSFVGRVQLGDINITVAPKLGAEQLLSLFRYAYGLHALSRTRSVGFATGHPFFQDLIVDAIYQEALALVRRGLVRRYRVVSADLGSPRGRIDLRRLVGSGGLPSATLPCRMHVRDDDWVLNRVVLGGLRLGGLIARDRELTIRVGRLAEAFSESVSEVPLDRALIRTAYQALDRTVAIYEPSLKLIAALLDGRGLSLDDVPDDVAVPGFLFDMNRFFQAILSRFLRENLSGYEVRDEHSLSSLLRYAPEANPRSRRAPRPRPDFACLAAGRVITLIDAKYRDLWENSLPREMLYQLTLYALSLPAGSTATLLYPTVSVGAREARIEVGDPLGGWGRAQVALRPVDLAVLAEVLSSGEAPTVRARRAALAHACVFGG